MNWVQINIRVNEDFRFLNGIVFEFDQLFLIRLKLNNTFLLLSNTCKFLGSQKEAMEKAMERWYL